jgi:hypothetical protein
MCEARVSELGKQFSQSLVVSCRWGETISNRQNLWRKVINQGNPTDKRSEAPPPVFQVVQISLRHGQT